MNNYCVTTQIKDISITAPLSVPNPMQHNHNAQRLQLKMNMAIHKYNSPQVQLQVRL